MNAVKKENGRVCIEGVRRVSWDSGEMCEFASSFVAAAESLGDELPYQYVMGTSGVAFRFTLHPGEWDFGNYSFLNVTPDPYEPVRRAFKAAGYGVTICEKSAYEEDAARIMHSIDQGVPVLAFNVVGPSNCVVISGYDEGGQVLMGWSTYQNIPQDHNEPPDATGYFRKHGWHDNLNAYFLVGAKGERPPLRDVYLDAVKFGVDLIRTPNMGKMATGLEGLRVWADEMTQAQYFPADDPDLVGWRYVSVAINMTMLRDHCLAEPFLRQAAVDVPDFAPELTQAANCYAEVKRIRDGMDSLIGDGFDEKSMKAIYDPTVRAAYAESILRIRDAEVEAAAHMAHLLERIMK